MDGSDYLPVRCPSRQPDAVHGQATDRTCRRLGSRPVERIDTNVVTTGFLRFVADAIENPQGPIKGT